jgi:acetylornithine/succinyldiaminopimelate/putrescine aminotransferase
MTERELFLRHIAQTSPSPLALEIVKAEGCFLTDINQKKYLDLIGGISVANTGHRHPKIIEAIKEQSDHYLQIMVYGEFIESPQVRYAKLLCENLPPGLNSVFFTNSGAEAVEGAMKLAKRVTNRPNIICFDKSYHGSTQGALSLIGDEYWRNAFRPLLPGITHLEYNSFEALDAINDETAMVIAETVQGEAGVIAPSHEWIKSLREKCTNDGCLLVLDEIQAGFGRTGTLWGFENFDIVPDVLLLGKALGGGLPLGAFIADKKIMDQLTENPVLGHISTFGGHPLSCSAGLASLELLLNENWVEQVKEKETFIKSLCEEWLAGHRSPMLKEIRSFGLWMAIELVNDEALRKMVAHCIENGVLTDWFLFSSASLRISPPLTISKAELETGFRVILAGLENNK